MRSLISVKGFRRKENEAQTTPNKERVPASKRNRSSWPTSRKTYLSAKALGSLHILDSETHLCLLKVGHLNTHQESLATLSSSFMNDWGLAIEERTDCNYFLYNIIISKHSLIYFVRKPYERLPSRPHTHPGLSDILLIESASLLVTRPTPFLVISPKQKNRCVWCQWQLLFQWYRSIFASRMISGIVAYSHLILTSKGVTPGKEEGR